MLSARRQPFPQTFIRTVTVSMYTLVPTHTQFAHFNWRIHIQLNLFCEAGTRVDRRYLTSL